MLPDVDLGLLGKQVAEDGARQEFCCRGCLGAFRMICSAGLGRFYQRDDRSMPTIMAPEDRRFSDEDLSRHMTLDGENCRLDILVGGISCPSCIWLLERMVARVAGVADVSISYAGGIASVRFDPGQAPPSEIFAAISSLGFKPRPYSPALSELEACRERNDLLVRFGTALFLTMQLMAYSYSLYAGYFQGMGPGIKTVLQYASCIVATPVVFYCGWPFLAGSWQSLRSRRPGMDLLIAVGALTAWIYSTWALVYGRETYYESAAMIVTFVLLGRLLELSVRRAAMSGVESLYAAVGKRLTYVLNVADDRYAARLAARENGALADEEASQEVRICRDGSGVAQVTIGGRVFVPGGEAKDERRQHELAQDDVFLARLESAHNNLKRMLTTETHTEVVNRSYEELMETGKGFVDGLTRRNGGSGELETEPLSLEEKATMIAARQVALRAVRAAGTAALDDKSRGLIAAALDMPEAEWEMRYVKVLALAAIDSIR